MSSPDSLHCPDITSSLSSVESLRTSIPEKHRPLFDSLRKDIIDYCNANTIPVPSHASLDAFEQTMRTRRIPIPILKHLSLLLTRLEYLVAHKKPIPPERDPEFREALEYAQERYHLREQYASQLAILKGLDIIRQNAINGLGNWKYPVPSLEKIALRLFKERAALAPKYDQGFAKLVLVPFGMGLDDLFQTFRHFLRSHPELHIEKRNPLDTSDLYRRADQDGSIYYYPLSSFRDLGYPDACKTTILQKQMTEDNPSTSTPGWQIHLFQPSDPWNPFSKGITPVRRAEGIKIYGIDPERIDFEPGKSPENYLIDLSEGRNNPGHPYHLESGLSPEDWIMACITHLTETGELLDQAKTSQDEFGVYLIGSFFDFSHEVPVVYSARRGIVQFHALPAGKTMTRGIARTSVRI